MKQLVKRWLALGMSFAMAFTMIPAGSGDVVKADETEAEVTFSEDPNKDSLLAAYDFNVETAVNGTTIPDISGNGKDATIKGNDAAVADGMLTLPGGSAGSDKAYVDIPGSVFENQDTLTISIWLKNETGSNNYSAMSFGTPTTHVGGGTSDMPLNYWILNPAVITTGYFKSVWTDSNDATGPYNTETAVSSTKTDSNWRMYTTVITENEIIGYYDGVEVCRDTKSKKTSDFGTGLYACIGRSGYNDMFYKGGVYGVRVYGDALSQQDIWDLYYRDMPGALDSESIANAVIEEVKTALDLDFTAVSEDLTLPAQGAKGATITWKSSNTDVITDDGKVTRSEDQDVSLTLTATIKVGNQTGTKEFTATVLNAGPEGHFKEMVSNLSIGITSALEDFELPNTAGEYTSVTWTSSSDAIRIEETSDGKILGKVIRPDDENVEVTLTATVDYNDGTNTFTDSSRTFNVKVFANVLNKAIESYDFADFNVSDTDSNILTDSSRELKLEGNGKKPALIEDDVRGQVLSLTEQSYSNMAYALLPENPFAGKSVDNGFTLSFWTKTTGTPNGAKCLVDFEVAPAENLAAISDPGRAGTLAVNQQMVYWNTTSQNGYYTDFNIGNMDLTVANGWTMVTMAVTKTGIAFYRNGVKINHSKSGTERYDQMINDLAGTSGIATPEQTNVRLGASLATYWTCAGALMDDVSFFEKALSSEEVSTLYQETKVNVPLDKVEVAGENTLVVGETLQLNAALVPTYATVEDKTATWNVADEDILKISQSGMITALKTGETAVTATVAGIVSEPFKIYVVAETENLASGKYLTVYSTTKPFYANTANLTQETRSVYMAVSEDGKVFNVLNNGGGVIFSKNTDGTLQITKPKIYKDNGKFTVVAPDADASKGLHVFTSTDGVKYYDDTLVASSELGSAPLKKTSFSLMLKGENILDTDDTITLGNAVALTDEEYAYIVNKLGTVVNTGLDSLEPLEITSDQADAVTESLLAEQYPSVDALYSDGSTQNFKIDWSDALDDIDLTQEGDYTVTGTVVQTKYLNNLKELNNSTLPDDDPENVPAEGESFPDNYDPETGKVYYDSTKFIEGMADPNIYWDEVTQYYYMTASYFPEDGDQIDANDTLQQYDRVVLRRGKTLEELQTRSDQVTIWKVGNQGYDDNGTQQASGYRYIWAPELHRVGDYWVVYFTESHSNRDAYNIYSHALVLDGNMNPYDTALTASDEASQWKDYKMCVSSSVTTDPDSDIPRDPFSLSFCLDMTYFKDEVNDTSYVIWAGKPTVAYQGGNTDLFIATVDEEQPWMITSNATRLTKADYGWERVRYCVNEGPTVLQKDGNIFMCYSVSGTGSEYAIGMLNATGGADLLDADVWTKSPYPLLTSRDVDGEEGPGHNSFTVDKDGNVIFVYHARPTSHNYAKCGNYNSDPLKDPCRHARLKRVHWAADGTPILKMTYEDELIDEYQTVSLTISVGNGGSDLPVPVSSVSLSETKLSLAVGETSTLTATVLPEDATHKSLTWSSSNPSVATVGDGTVTARAAGTTTITATAVSGVSASCEVTVTASTGDEPDVAVTGITLDKTSLSLKEGESDTLTAIVEPSNATDPSITWTSSNSTVATVAAGKVTAVKTGTAVITAKAGDKTATCQVTVTASTGNVPSDVPVTGITLNKTALALTVGAAETLTATILPGNATVKTVTWKSSNTSIATVDEAGKVTAVKAGTAAITVTTANGKTASCAVTVTESASDVPAVDGTVAVTSVTLSKKTLKLGIKETFTLKATIKPSNATNTAVSWKSSNTNVATVKNGKITTKKKGTANITATVGGKTATCKVTVCAAPTKITLKKTKVSVKKGKTAQITVKSFKPKKAYCTIFTYSSKNKKIATVSSTGKITGKKKGTTTITVTCKNNKKAKATVKVTVK